MGDPELRSDEKVLLRTPGVYVKSIPFEGILTNKRIILVDRAKNLLPSKEIPLVTIKEAEPGENAIRDQIITLSVMAKTGEIRQMILTFSRQAGGNRIKERDAWVRIIRENASSSFDQVIRNVIPGTEQPRRTDTAGVPRYPVVPPAPQPAAPYEGNRPAGTTPDGMNPVRRPVAASPGPAAPPSPAPRQYDTSSPGQSIFCSKCGNRVPAESVFCNRCGSPLAPVPSVYAPVQSPPAAPPVVRTPAARPIDEEIRSIEPLIERSTVKIPPDPLRSAPAEPSLRPALSWDDEVKPEPVSPQEAQPMISPVKSAEAAPRVPSYGGTGDTPPPKPPRRGSFIPGKQTILAAAAVLVAILIVAAGVFLVYPMLTEGGTATPGGETITPVTTTRPVAMGTIIPIVTTARPIPATGIFVHISYLGGFEGSYGMPDILTTVPGNSGDRVWEVENANGTVVAEFTKQDGSARELLVEIYKDGKLLTGGSTTVGHGKVALSVDTDTGIAAAPVTSGSASTAAVRTTTVAVAAAATTTTLVVNTTPTAS